MTVTIGRRELLAALGGAAAWPLATRAQQAARLPTIGFLGASASIESQRVAAFVQRLRELAWIDGRNLAIEYRWAEGRNERYAEAAAELVRLKVDVIVTVATPATLAAKQATTGHTDRVRGCVGPGRDWLGGEPGATGRQRHWSVKSDI
jgi:putative ABC transport system substrate-binding protein